MRISTFLVATVVLAVAFALLRDDVGRVAVIVFVSGLCVVASALSALVALFRTLGAFGEARTAYAYVEASVATAVVLVVGSSLMLLAIFAGAWLVRWAIP